ncbi:MAG: hypothetical protein F6J97_04280 [Leptolyngbya sp. SIO4C1]|nr:hypothetical protein [Leptolyngbya sp. SIO4C1]
MANNPSHRDSLTPQAQAEQDLLKTVLDTDWAYPWLPSDPAAAAYLDALEEAGEELEFSASEATAGWQTLSTQLEAQWAKPSLQTALQQKFGTRLAPGLVAQIIRNSKQLVASGRPVAEQIVACVQDALSDWDPTDLQVMARPLAYAMRGQEEILDVTIQSVREADWETLSPMEQARISLAAARYALDYLNHQHHEPEQA